MSRNSNDATLRKGSKPTAEKVREAVSEKNAHRNAVKKQTESNELGIQPRK